MRTRLVFMLSLLSILASSELYAVRVTSIYQADVPVSSQAVEIRNQALKQGLEQVLTKITGNSSVVDNSAIKSQLDKADSLVEEFSYTSSPKTPATPYIIHIKFDDDAINHMVRNAGVPMWGKNRPLILAWVEYEAPGQAAVIIDSNSVSPIQTLIKQGAEQHGLPVMLPMMDVADMNQIGVNDIVTMALPTLEAASTRYASDALLIARVFKLTTGYSIQSKLVLGEIQWSLNATGNTMDEAWATLLDNIGNTLAGRYATVITKNVQTQLTLKIVGISREGDLEQVMQYVKNLSPVADVQPQHIETDTAVLVISIRGPKQAFAQAISAEQKLQLIGDPDESIQVYQWNP